VLLCNAAPASIQTPLASRDGTAVGSPIESAQSALPTIIYRLRCCGLVHNALAATAPYRFTLPFGCSAVRAERFMNTHVNATPSWSTASFGAAPDTSPMELTALGEHLDLCRGSRGRLFALHCAAQTLHGFVAPRLVTTLVVAALLIGVTYLML
jgi:hypothetical protein